MYRDDQEALRQRTRALLERLLQQRRQARKNREELASLNRELTALGEEERDLQHSAAARDGLQKAWRVTKAGLFLSLLGLVTLASLLLPLRIHPVFWVLVGLACVYLAIAVLVLPLLGHFYRGQLHPIGNIFSMLAGIFTSIVGLPSFPLGLLLLGSSPLLGVALLTLSGACICYVKAYNPLAPLFGRLFGKTASEYYCEFLAGYRALGRLQKAPEGYAQKLTEKIEALQKRQTEVGLEETALEQEIASIQGEIRQLPLEEKERERLLANIGL